ncbi:MAG: hypothetical protein R3F25_06500 [Gammaproteobacteria bacterium]|jgi:hypothetical protein|nr:hypothetical protein [Xanthomonadales bacterium]
MMIDFKLKPLFVILLLLCSFSAFSQIKNNNEMSLEDATEYVRSTSKGKVLSAKTNVNQGKKSHRIQVLTPSGRVRVYQIDAQKYDNRREPDASQRSNSGSSYSRFSRQSQFNSQNNNYRTPSNNSRDRSRTTVPNYQQPVPERVTPPTRGNSEKK